MHPVSGCSAVTHVALTHGHDDHLGDTAEICKKTGATLFAVYELAVHLAGQGVEKYEPMMRRSATREIDTSRPLDVVIDEILSVVRPARDESRAGRVTGGSTSRSWGTDGEPS